MKSGIQAMKRKLSSKIYKYSVGIFSPTGWLAFGYIALILGWIYFPFMVDNPRFISRETEEFLGGRLFNASLLAIVMFAMAYIASSRGSAQRGHATFGLIATVLSIVIALRMFY